MTNEETQSEPTHNHGHTTAKEITYWLTRDSDAEGELEKEVDVWLARPTRYPLPGNVGAVWMVHPEDLMVETAAGDVPARYTTWSVHDCLRKCYVYPETDRECVKVGE